MVVFAEAAQSYCQMSPVRKLSEIYQPLTIPLRPFLMSPKRE